MSIKSRFVRLARNTGFILILALTAGLLFGEGAPWLKSTVTPLLGLVMTLSILGISSTIFLDLKRLSRPIVLSMILNYIVLSGTLIGLSYLIIPDVEVRMGFIIVAAMPTAVAVIPFSYHLDGNIPFSLIGTVATYLAALVIAPMIFILFLGTNLVEPTKLLIALAELIVVPLLFSRILRLTPIVSTLEKYRGFVVNWSFFVLVYTIVGLNRDAFLGQPETLLRISTIAFASTFILGELINRLSKLLGVDKPDRVSLILLATRKNYGLAAAIALAFFDSRATMPSAVAITFAITHFISLTLRFKRAS